METQKEFVMLKLNEVKAITKLSRSTIYERMAKKSFPKPIKLGERSVAWLAHEVQNWLNERIAATRECQS